MRKGIAAVAAALVAITASAGCDGSGPDLVAKGTPPATPYSGPLKVPSKNLDEDSARAMRLAAGAAGRALECDGEIYTGASDGSWSEDDGGATPEEGLQAYFDLEQAEDPHYGYRVERRERDRVLYSFDVHGRTKVAVVVAKDQKGRPGWGPESNASCDPAELPASFTDSKPYEIWTDRDGHRVATTVVSSNDGPEHCGWQSAVFLHTGRGEGGKQYARDPHGVLGRELLTSAYDGQVRMPADAHDTGYRLNDRELWFTGDRSKAYVRTSDGVELWPATKERVACL
ncbi:hypothetical protein ACWGDT_31485 [Streptomyces avermitilis]